MVLSFFRSKIPKIFTVNRRGKKHCKYCCEMITVIHNRSARKVNDFEINYCFHCGKKF